MAFPLLIVIVFFSIETKQTAAAGRVLSCAPPPPPSAATVVPDPTDGFTEMALNSSNFVLRKPYNLPKKARYSYDGDIHKFWVYSTDKPLAPSSPTNPRSEMRIQGYDYTSGIWQFEGHVYVPKWTAGVCVMQVFGALGHPTTLMLKVYSGSLFFYKLRAVAMDIYDRWFRINVIHDADARTLQIFIDGRRVMGAPNRTLATHWFQFGVYMQDNLTDYMESRWRGIRVLKKTSFP